MRGNALANLVEKRSSVSVDKNWCRLPVGGITPFTTIDFPNRLAAVIYTHGCSWSCRYCHNAELRGSSDHPFDFEKLIQFLEDRKGKLDGVVFSGGEPSIHDSLSTWMRYAKTLGYEVGLHTSGMFPERLKNLLPLCDWVGMDIKAPFNNYDKVTLVEESGIEAKKSARLLLDSGVDYEFRTTVHPNLLSENDIKNIARELEEMGAKRFVIQAFQPEGCEDEELSQVKMPVPIISEELYHFLDCKFDFVDVRQ